MHLSIGVLVEGGGGGRGGGLGIVHRAVVGFPGCWSSHCADNNEKLIN